MYFSRLNLCAQRISYIIVMTYYTNTYEYSRLLLLNFDDLFYTSKLKLYQIFHGGSLRQDK